MSQAYPYNQPDQTYPYNNPNQAYPLNYFVSVISNANPNTVLLNFVQTTWQAFVASPQTISEWLSNNQLTIDQLVRYMNNWFQTQVGQAAYGVQFSIDYTSPSWILPWMSIVQSNNMTPTALSGFFASTYLLNTAIVNFLGSGIPIATNYTNFGIIISVIPFLTSVAMGISNAASVNSTNTALVINSNISPPKMAWALSQPWINQTAVAMSITNPAINTTQMALILDNVPLYGNITGMAAVLSNPAVNYTTEAYIIVNAAINYTYLALIYNASNNYTTLAYVLFTQPIVTPQVLYSILSNANMSANSAQRIYYPLAILATSYAREDWYISFLTYNAPSVTLSANTTVTGVVFYQLLALNGYTLTTSSQPTIVVAQAISMSGGAITQSTTGGVGGSGAASGGRGGGGLVVVAITGIIDGTISANGGAGGGGSTTSSAGYGGNPGSFVTIRGILYTASTGGAGGGGYYGCGGGGGGVYGGPAGANLGSCTNGAAAGSSISVAYSYATATQYVSVLLQALGDQWQIYVRKVNPSSTISLSNIVGYGAGGGGGSSQGTAGGGGGGGSGGQIIVYMHNLNTNTRTNITANGGSGGSGIGSGGGGGGGGGGGLIYIIYHNLITWSGVISVSGGAGGASGGGTANAGGAGTPNTYAIFVV